MQNLKLILFALLLICAVSWSITKIDRATNEYLQQQFELQCDLTEGAQK